MPESDTRLRAALARIDAGNAEDPEGRELLYGERMSAWLERLEPEPSEALRIAVRAQHLGRWRIPRRDYPEGRTGYLTWRNDLAKLHADLAGAIVRDAGYDEETVERVGRIVRKRGLRTDPEAQTLEDVACLVFLEHYFADFARQHDDAKVVAILRKTWGKMSERGRQAALGIELGDRERGLLDRALSGE